MVRAWLACFVALVMPLAAEPVTPDQIAKEVLAPLLDPAKVATLKGDRPVNARLYRVLYWLETAHQAGGHVPAVIDQAQAVAGYGGSVEAVADARAITAAHARMAAWRCYSAAGMEKLRRGGSPRIELGPHAGEIVHIDHVLPVSIVPALRAKFFNLRPEPATVNLAKGNGIGPAEMELARRWSRRGILSPAGLAAVERAASPQ